MTAEAGACCRVNGRDMPLAPGLTLEGLLHQLGLAGKRVAVECNGQLVVRSQLAETPVCNGDSIEIVRAVGGG